MSSLEEVIGYRFRDKELLAEALTHTSHANETGSARHNERLEFLGDSVLGLVVSYYLFLKNPSENEGFLSDLKAAVVSGANQARWAERIGLGRHLRLGAGEHLGGGASSQSILSGAMEAVLGAVYLDGGLAPVEKIVIPWLESQAFEALEVNHKKALQELIQKKHKRPPDYELMSEAGPAHERLFTVRVYLGRKTLGLGSGKSKKEAQQAAAKNALDYLATHELHKHEI